MSNDYSYVRHLYEDCEWHCCSALGFGPREDLILQFRNPRIGVFVMCAAEFQPYFNIADLEWKLTGIARWQLEAAGLAEKFLRADE
jgi:hypothetical protein